MLTAIARATGTLVGYNHRHRPPRTNRTVHTPHFIALAAPLAALEQHRAHRPNSGPERLHIHQRSVPARAAVASVSFRTTVPGSGGRLPMQVRHGGGGGE